jgi:hypothetical protein
VIRIEKRLPHSGGDRGRPIIVKLEEDHQPWEILRNGKNLRLHRSEKIRRIRIANDLTAEQRVEEDRMFKEIKDR